MTIQYKISECQDGRLVVQTPNGIGGLFPLGGCRAKIRDMAEAFKMIHTHAINFGLIDGKIEITYLSYENPNNSYRMD